MGVTSETSKGDLNQILWVDCAKSILENNKDLNNVQRNLLMKLAAKPNLPKKKAKFKNFAKNVTNNKADEIVIEGVWTLLEDALKKLPSEKCKRDINQMVWVDTVKSILQHNKELGDGQRNLLLCLAARPNLPKKKEKFENFAKNITDNNVDKTVIQSVWNLLEGVLKKIKDEKQKIHIEKYKKTHPKMENIVSDVSGSDTMSKEAKLLKKKLKAKLFFSKTLARMCPKKRTSREKSIGQPDAKITKK